MRDVPALICVAAWFEAVVFMQKSIFDNDFLQSTGARVSALQICLNATQRLLRCNPRVNNSTVATHRVAAILTLRLLHSEQTAWYRQRWPFLARFSMHTLLHKLTKRTVYMVCSYRTRKFYIGKVGENTDSRPVFDRYGDHVSMSLAPVSTRNKSSNSVLYRALARIGVHKFVLIPIFVGDVDPQTHDRLETFWIRRLYSRGHMLNTRKLPKSNVRALHDGRAYPHRRQTATSTSTSVFPVRCATWTVQCTHPRILSCPTGDAHDCTNTVRFCAQHGIPAHQVTVVKSPGNMSLLRLVTVRRALGRSTVRVNYGADTQLLSLSRVLSLCKRWPQRHFSFTFHTWRWSGVETTTLYSDLITATTHRHSRARHELLHEADLATLCKTWTCLKHIPERPLRETAQALLQDAFKRRRVNPMPSNVVVLPFRPDVSLHALRQIPRKILDSLRLGSEYRTMLKGELRAVFSRRMSIADRLVNFRKLAKSVDVANPPPCTCRQLCADLGIAFGPCHLTRGHVAVRATDLPETVPALLRGNLKNIPTTDLDGAVGEIHTAMLKWFRELLPHVQFTKDHASEFWWDRNLIKIFDMKVNLLTACEPCPRPLATVTAARMQRWHAEWLLVREHDPTLFGRLSSGDFLEDTLRMVRTHTSRVDANHWINNQEIYRRLRDIFGIDVELFASPLNFNLCHRAYCSEHDIDKLFGSLGNAFSHRWAGKCIGNPIYSILDIRKSISKAIEAVNADPSALCILNIPLWDQWHDEYFHLLTHRWVTPLFIFGADSYAFHHPAMSSDQVGRTRAPTAMAPWPVGFFLVQRPAITPPQQLQLDAMHELFTNMGFFPFDDSVARDYARSHTGNDASWEPVPIAETRHHASTALPGITRAKTIRRTDAVFQLIYERQFGVDLTQLIQDMLAASPRVHRATPGVCNVSPDQLAEINALCAKLRKHCVFQLDKNDCCALFTCRRYAFDSIMETFVNDPHYSATPLTQDDILKSWREQFASLDLGRFQSGFSVHPRHKLPYVYTMPKNKDINKFRPIMSYCTHPLRTTLRRACRALRFALRSYATDHMDMPTTSEFLPRVSSILAALRAEGYDRVHMLAGDIKQMYTELNHDFIMEAVDWLLDIIRAQKRRQESTTIAVPRRGKKWMGMGKSHNPHAFVNFTLLSLRNIVKFDLANAYFTVGTHVMKQNIGIPMGSPLSPALAVIVCAYSEHLYSKKQTAQGYFPLVRGLRYVDDALYITGSKSCEVGSAAVAEFRLRQIAASCYHNDLVVELDPDQTVIHMLESEIDLTSNPNIDIRFWHKNRDHLDAFGTQKFLKFQHYSSFSPLSAKRGVLVSTLLRVARNSLGDENTLYACRSIIRELKLLHYSNGCIAKAIKSVSGRFCAEGMDRSVWGSVLRLLNDDSV